MALTFSAPPNINAGTSVADGFRVAPPYATLATTGVDSAGKVLSYSSYQEYGPGLLLSTLSTYNIVPYPTTPFNIVAESGVAAAGWLTLKGDAGATTLVASGDSGMFPPGAPNNFYVQFDYPRVPAIEITTDNLPGPVNVTIFGSDWYGMPMQHTYVVENEGTYPSAIYMTPLTPTPSFPQTPDLNGKAFYRITGIYFNGVTGPAGVGCTATNTFGLPYCLGGSESTVGFGWAGYDLWNPGGVADLTAGTVTVLGPLSNVAFEAIGAGTPYLASTLSLTGMGDTAPTGALRLKSAVQPTIAAPGNFIIESSEATDTGGVMWTMSNAGKYLVRAGDGGIAPPLTTAYQATAYTSDVRGLVQLPDLTEVWAPLPNGTHQLTFTYYAYGFDQWLNILNAGGQPQLDGTPVRDNQGNVIGNITPANNFQSMYGIPQYYTGIPA